MTSELFTHCFKIELLTICLSMLLNKLYLFISTYNNFNSFIILIFIKQINNTWMIAKTRNFSSL